MGQYYRACYQEKTTKRWKGFSAWNTNNGAKLTEHSFIGNHFVEQLMDFIFRNPRHVVWAGDYAKDEKGGDNDSENLYHTCTMRGLRKVKHQTTECRFAINHTKKVFIDIFDSKEDKYGMRANILPLLLAEGNGSGGGDYRGINENQVGIWARDLIEIDSIRSNMDYKKVEFHFDNY